MSCDLRTPLPIVQCGPIAQQAYRLAESPSFWRKVNATSALPWPISCQADAVEFLQLHCCVSSLIALDDDEASGYRFLELLSDLAEFN